MKKIGLTLVSFLFVFLFTFSAYSQERSRPDLTPEALAAFPPGSELIILSATCTETIAVYDGAGKFLFEMQKNGITDPMELTRMAAKEAKLFELARSS